MNSLRGLFSLASCWPASFWRRSFGWFAQFWNGETMTGLFQLGDFTLNSGAKSRWKLECDAITDADWDFLAYMVWQMVGPFDGVEGVPRGGLKLAERLQQYSLRDTKDGLAIVGSLLTSTIPYLIVDDVLTTGGSMQKAKAKWEQECKRPYLISIGAVVFARGECPVGVKALFTMPEEFWLKPKVQ